MPHKVITLAEISSTKFLTQPDCVGINFRKCLTETNEEHLVYTGVDSDGKDIVEYSVVTNTGDIIKQDGIVADRVWILDVEAAR